MADDIERRAQALYDEAVAAGYDGMPLYEQVVALADSLPADDRRILGAARATTDIHVELWNEPERFLVAAERSLALYRRAFGDVHPALVYPLIRTAQAHDLSGQDDEAVRCYRQALDVADRVGDDGLADEVLRRLAGFYEHVERLAESAAAYRERLDRIIMRMRRDEPQLAYYSLDWEARPLLEALVAQSAHEEAESLCREVLALLDDEMLAKRYMAWFERQPDEVRARYVRTPNPDYTRHEWYLRLAEACLPAGKYAEAEELAGRFIAYEDERVAESERQRQSRHGEIRARMEAQRPAERGVYCRRMSSALGVLAEALRGLGRIEEAEETQAQADALKKEQWDMVHNLRARMRQAEEQWWQSEPQPDES